MFVYRRVGAYLVDVFPFHKPYEFSVPIDFSPLGPAAAIRTSWRHKTSWDTQTCTSKILRIIWRYDIYIYVYITSSYCVYSIVLFRTVSYRTISCNFYTCTKYQMCVFKVTNSNMFFFCGWNLKKIRKKWPKIAEGEPNTDVEREMLRCMSPEYGNLGVEVAPELTPCFASGFAKSLLRISVQTKTWNHKQHFIKAGGESYASQEGISGFKKTTCSPEK